MRVIRVIPSLARSFGGPPRVVVESAIQLVAAGVDVTIFTTDSAHPSASPRRAERSVSDLVEGSAALDVRTFPLGWPSRLGFAKGLRRALAEAMTTGDVVDIHGLWLYPSWAGSTEARAGRCPYIVWPHGALAPVVRANGRVRKMAFGALWHHRFLDEAAAWRVATPREAVWVTETQGDRRVFVVPNGLDIDRFTVPASPIGFMRDHLMAPDCHPVLLALGRIAAIKGLDVAVGALAALVGSGFPNAVLCVVGPDSEGLGDSLRAHATSLGVGDRLVMTGSLSGDDLLAALAAADVLVVPSLTENFGNALLEAMAAGVPAVMAPGVALGPDIEAAGAGLVAQRDGEAFALAVASLLSDSVVLRRRRAAAATFASGFSWSLLVPDYIDMYEDVLRAVPRGL